MMTRVAVAMNACLLILAWEVCAQDVRRADDLRFFEQRVRPLLAARCYECHGTEKQEGELRLDSYAALLRGGASGAVLVAGQPDDSLLLAAVGYKNEELQMPPDQPLSAEEVAILREWVTRGLPHPEADGAPIKPLVSIDLERGREFWAFQPPQAAPLPAVADSAWCQTPIDRFVLAELEAHGLRPSAAADRATWLRRVTLDLTGLPPSIEDLRAFLADQSPQAAERVVDRLLSSPRYGERWGRHWLDIARYADSNGLDENVAHGNAWRYRDYVIDAFNRDLPFTRFVREQIAGDLLPADTEPQRHEHLIATGFLSLGAKVLAEVDEMKMEMDIVDEQIDTFGRAFLAMTLGCARCHDHKFDPIRTDDYYALAGIFQSTKTMENFKKVARWHENPIATPEELAAKAEYDGEVAAAKDAVQRVIDQANESLLAAAGPGATLPKDAEQQYPDTTKAELKELREALQKLEKNPPPMSTAMGAQEGTLVDAAICLRGSHLTRGRVVPRGVPAVMSQQPLAVPTGHSGRLELADWLTGPGNPLLARVIVNRVWRWHFGRGLVESTDNFGALGDQPTHPALLDWLAVRFTQTGGSLKALHRLIVTSATYGQSSAVSGGEAGKIDPENRWLSRFPARRLEVEAIRDSLLLVSGQLDLTAGGSLLHVGNRQYLFDHTSQDNTKYDSPRRTVYLPVVRNNLFDMSQLFDATDATVPEGDRASSTVATQALFMMNSSLVMDAARSLADLACTRAGDDPERIGWLFERCYGRSARDEELALGLAYLARCSTASPSSDRDPETVRREGWQSYCQVLLCSSEFMYVR